MAIMDDPLAEAWVVRHHEHIVALARVLHAVTQEEPLVTESGPQRRRRWTAASYTIADAGYPVMIVGETEEEKEVTIVSTTATGGGTVYLSPEASMSTATSLSLPPGAQWSLKTHGAIYAWASTVPVSVTLELEIEDA